MIALLALLLAQIPPEFKLIAELASSLSEGNAVAAMDTFDKSTPGYDTISANVFAMVAQADVSCTIDPIQQTGHTIEVDWFLKLNSKADEGPTERRQMHVNLTIQQTGKRWKIVRIEPASILDPPKT
jgi:hypothetical protein